MNRQKIDIKSPIFKPKPGWGGKVRIWFKEGRGTVIYPVVSVAVFGIGLYLVFFT